MADNILYSVIVWSSDDTPYGTTRVLFLTEEKQKALAFCKEYAESKRLKMPLRALYVVEQKLNDVFNEPDAGDCIWANY